MKYTFSDEQIMRTLLRALWAEGENVIVLFSLMTLANICQFVSTSSKPDHISIEWLLTITLAASEFLNGHIVSSSTFHFQHPSSYVIFRGLKPRFEHKFKFKF